MHVVHVLTTLQFPTNLDQQQWLEDVDAGHMEVPQRLYQHCVRRMEGWRRVVILGLFVSDALTHAR